MEFDLKGRRLILASKSPRRQFLLKELEIPFQLNTKDVDESFPHELKAEQIPLYLSRKKAEAFISDIDEYSIVLTADTIVWINDHVLNKPANEFEALAMLKEMQGTTHEVFTGVTLYSMMNETSFSVRSEVEF
ncbi:MAG TPA: Maf family protein, partial [Bacteroidia bacterium]|nr:Maf family protein [Bacteroidia bacterium]